MNKDLNLKKFQFVLVAFAMIVVGMFMSFLPMQSVFAESEEAYYYSKLNDNLSKKFYNAICKMEEQNLLASGISEFNLIDNKILTQAEINQYLSGNSEVLKSFGAGRDAYVLDYAGNFYTDFSKLSLSIGTKNGKYIATLGTGRADNYYIDENLTNNLVADKKVALSDKVSSLLGDYSDLSVLQQIELANQIVINNVSYNFCNDIDKQEFAPYIRTAYGALCNGYAVCEGYARALKVLLDEMGINNILVYGYLLSNQGAYEEHMWNYVEIEHKWYAIDSTLNDSMGEKSYYLKGADEFNYDHLANGVISEANYEFTYPVLNTYNYGEESLPTVIEYNDVGDTKFLYVTTSYNNKNATDLASEGLYLSYNYSTQTSTENAITWTQWFAMSVVMSFEDFKESFEETSTATTMKDYGSSPFIKFALIKGAPTGLLGRYENVANDDIVCQSDIITNEAYDGYVAAPFAYKVTPANTAKLDINKTYDITLKYDEQLIKTDDLEVGVSVTSTHEATSDDYSLTNIQWNENTNELSFQFKPSKKFIHNGDGYCFTPTNLVGQDSGKTPHAVSYSFQYTSIVCNKILDGGRLYMDVVGHPRLIDNSDLSMSNWDLNGEPVCQNQRSQIALVVTNTSEEDKNDMIASAVETTSSINQNDVLSSSTYEIDLDLCGFLTRVPNGTYMKLSFGFPKGYSANDKGVTFKVYHFKRDDNGNIDTSKTVEIPCVITEYGLVVEVNDFSPFAVLALPKDKVATTTKTIYSRTINIGGNVESNLSTSKIASLNENETITYSFTADSNYKLDYVLLNQKELKVVDNKVTLSYADLQSDNVLEVAFVSNRVAQVESEQGITNLQKEFSVNYGVVKQDNKVNFILIVAIVVFIIIIVCVLILLKRKSAVKNNKNIANK